MLKINQGEMMELTLYILIGLLAIVCLKLIFIIANQCKLWITFRSIPSPNEPAYPLIGHALVTRGNPDEMYENILTRFKTEVIPLGLEIIHVWIGPVPVVIVVGAKAAEVLLQSTEHIEKSYFYTFLHSWLGTGLLTAKGKKWKTRRRMLTPTFHFRILQDFLDVMNEQAAIFVGRLKKYSDSEEIINIFNPVTLCALDIICETAMGISTHAQDNQNSDYVKALINLSEIIQERQKSPWLWWDPYFNRTKKGKDYARYLETMHDFTRSVIKSRTEHFKTDDAGAGKQAKRLAFLDMLLTISDEKKFLSSSDIQEEVDTFMFEGHDTTAAAMTWAIHLIGKHSDVQKKIQAELDEVLGEETGKTLTMDDVKKLEYLERAIKESLRLYPSVPIIGRVTTSDCILDGHKIPVQTQCLIFPQLINTNEHYWTETDKYDPERFSKDNSIGRHPFAYIPFSAGPRNCIGQKFALMEEKVILAYFFHKYSVTSTDNTDDIRLMGDIILRPGDGVNIQIKKRR